MYCRDFWVNSLVFQFWFYIVWGLIVSFMMFYLTYYSCRGAFLSNGMTIDYLNTGVITFYVNIASHHLFTIAETSNHTWFTTAFYALSLSLVVLTIWFNDIYKPSEYFGH